MSAVPPLHPRVKVLCVGNDLTRLQLRALVLETAGLQARGEVASGAPIAISKDDFDAIAVFGEVDDHEWAARRCVENGRRLLLMPPSFLE